MKNMHQKSIKNKRIFKALSSVFLTVLIILVLWLGLNDNPMSGLGGTIGKTETAVDSPFLLTFIDVGQGDSTLLVCDGELMLIDTGESGSKEAVSRYISSLGAEKINYVVATHPHSDHIGSMCEIIGNYSPDFLLMPYLETDDDQVLYRIKEMTESASESGTQIVNPAAGDEFNVGSAKVCVVAPINDEKDDLNDMSIVLRITYGERSFLIMSDAGMSEEDDILQSGFMIKSDLLRVGHHGSSGSSSEAFLNAVAPECCVISVGADNDYGHPSGEAVGRILAVTDKIYRTDLCGNIIVRCDGKDYTVTYNR